MKPIVFYLLLLLPLSSCFAQEAYPFAQVKQQKQFHYLLKQLRCLVCQNQDLADSNAPLAKDLRDQIYQMVLAHKTDSEISQYLTNRYGDFILFKPPVKGVTYFLWFGPFLFLIAGLGIFWRTCLKRVAYE